MSIQAVFGINNEDLLPLAVCVLRPLLTVLRSEYKSQIKEMPIQAVFGINNEDLLPLAVSDLRPLLADGGQKLVPD